MAKLNQQATGQDVVVQKTLKAMEKVTVQLGKQKDRVVALSSLYEDMDEAQKSILSSMLNQAKYRNKLLKAQGDEEKLAKAHKEIEKDLEKVLKQRAQNYMDMLSNEEKAEKLADTARQKQNEAIEYRQKLADKLTLAEQSGSKTKIERAKKEIEENEKNIKKQAELKKKYDKEAEIYRTYSAENADKIIRANQLKEQQKELRNKSKLTPEEKKAYRERQKEISKIQNEVAKDEAKKKDEEDENGGLAAGFVPIGGSGGAKVKAGINFGNDANGNQITTWGGYLKKELGDAISAGFSNMSKSLDQTVDNAVKLISDYQQKINYRLETVSDAYSKDGAFDYMRKNVQKLVGNTGVVTQQKVIEAIGKAVDTGIAYNVEQRAFLSTIAENIQGTFETFDANLLRIVRIQQADSTAQRLGMEKALNDMLNSYYKDTTYLKDVFDNVSSSIFEMTANQTREQAVETEFVVQKWLGSLYSLGASSNAVQQIATGLGYLGSGNVQALAGNTGLQNLLALSASKAGLDYAGLLTNGMNGNDINRLMEAMVKYLSEIAEDTRENRVVTSSYGNIFGLSLSDVKSFANLSSSVSQIFGENMTYASSQEYLQDKLNNYVKYMGTAQYMSNMFENIKLGVGMTYADGGMYLFYKAVDMLDKLTNGGPTISVAPWGIGIQAKIFEIIKSGMFGAGLIGALVGGGLPGNNDALQLSKWGYEDVVSRGTGFGLKRQSGQSYQQNVGNASSSDVSDQTLKEGTDQATDIEDKSGKGQEKGIDDLYEALVLNGDKGQLSSVNQTVISMDAKLVKAMQLLDELSTTSSRKSVNINIQKVAGRDVGTGMDVPLATSPSTDWNKLIVAAAVLIKYGTQLGGFGGQAIQQMVDAEGSNEEATLQDFLDLIVPILQNDTGIPVRLESTDSMTNLLSDLTKR